MIERYPPAIWMPADKSNYRRAGRTAFDLIVIHCTDGRADPRAPAQDLQKPRHGSSFHFVVGQDGTIIQCVSLADIAWHAHAANGHSVSIEHCARSPKELGHDDPGMKPTPVQLAASARLCLWLCQQGGFEPSRATIKGHAEADPQTTHADCPEGSGIIVDAYVGLVFAIHGAPFA